ncbi:MAG: oligosaccharide repeat unit polymerase [Lentisphaeria bacterium]|nr:oligosaccharide repeat unit polymerase [Candidatus Neomarinimicrobiota bacterium]MCF7841817.1 oligosaccharide repeat unit polymerase [Lentisphaeria bacterium]
MSGRNFYLHLPILVFAVIWLTVISLYFNNPYNFPSLLSETKLILFSGILSVFAGYYLVHYFTTSLDNKIQQTKGALVVFDEKKMMTITGIMTILPIIGVILAFIFILELVGGAENFFTRPLYVRHLIVEFQRSTLSNWSLAFSVSNYFISVVYVCNLLGGVVFNFSSKWRYIGLLPIVVGAIASALFIRRYVFINAASFWLISLLFSSYYYPQVLRRKILRRFRMILMIIGIVFFGFTIVILTLRAVTDTGMADYFIESILSYYTGGVGAFNQMVTNNYDYTWGTTTFRSIFKWLDRLHLWDLDRIVGSQLEFVRVGRTWLNTYTYAYSFFRDFGLIGVLIMSLIWGGLTRYIMGLTFNKYSFVKLFWSVSLTFSFLMSFYSFFFDGLTTIVFWALIAWLVDRFMRKHDVYLISSPVIEANQNSLSLQNH